MTALLLDLRQDANGGSTPISGTLTANRIRIRRDGALVLYPGTLSFPLPGPINLDPPTAGDAWILRIYPDVGAPIVRTVTFSGATAAWADLVDVDPATLNPDDPDTVAAWTALLEQVEAVRDAILAATAPIVDAPDLTLLFENGLA